MADRANPDLPKPASNLRSLSVTSTTSFLQPSSQPTLKELKLSHILQGETCPPISFPDFSGFITYKEFSTENLLFVIWFRSFRSRWEDLPQDVRLRVPVPSTKLGDRYRPFEYLDRAQRGDVPETCGVRLMDNVIRFTSPFDSTPAIIPPVEHVSQSYLTPPEPSPEDDGVPDARGIPLMQPKSRLLSLGSARGSASETPLIPPPIIIRSSHPSLPPAGTTLTSVEDQPLREEALRAFGTFLHKGGSRELGISDELRDFAERCLHRSSAPEVFLPVYEEIYQALETQSLPHFLQHAKYNVNKPKQRFWYIVGAIDALIGIVIFVILTLVLSDRKFAYRAIRIPSAIFIWFGAGQIYSAYRGFCSQVWGRLSTQLKPWEMDQFDEESLTRGAPAPPTVPPITPNSRIPSRTDPPGSARSENIFTPKDDSDDFALPPGVQPLTDFTDTSPTFAINPWDAKINLPSRELDGPQRRAGSTSDDDELSEIAIKQLAIRRATIKAPDAALAFPLTDDPHPPATVTGPAPALTGTIAPAISDSRSDVGEQINSSAFGAEPPDSVLDQSAQTINVARANLNNLLGHFECAPHYKTEPERETARKKLPKTRMFGPEQIVQDPRIKQLYDSVIRDILIFGTTIAFVWIGICFAVPTYGLA